MGDWTHTNLPLHGLHVPDESVEVGPDGIKHLVPLPGKYQIWTEIDGVPVLLYERKAGKLLSKIEAANAAKLSEPPPTA